MAERVRQSVYLEWARTRPTVQFDLATSGVADYPVTDLPVSATALALGGSSTYGYAPLQARLAAKCGVEPEWIVGAVGCSMANFLVMAGCVDPGDEVLIEQPAYEPLVATAAFLGARIVRFPRRAEEAFRLDPRAIERAVTPRTRLVVVTNLHNPTSVRTEAATLAAVGEIARSVGARVLVDEVYLETVVDGAADSAWRLGSTFVVTSSLTKAYGLAGLRCGWVVAHPDLARRLWRIHDLVEVIPAHPAERLSCLALDHLPRIAARARDLLARNRAALARFLAQRADLLDLPPPSAGTVVFPRLRRGSVDALCALLATRYDTAVVPGRFFDAPDHFRLGLGGPPELVEEGLRRLGWALDALPSA